MLRFTAAEATERTMGVRMTLIERDTKHLERFIENAVNHGEFSTMPFVFTNSFTESILKKDLNEAGFEVHESSSFEYHGVTKNRYIIKW